jgi:IS5 family transposase
MRKTIEHQMQIGETHISDIKFDPRSRDDIPKILRGLQHIYSHSDLRESVFRIIQKLVPKGVAMDNGRPGMFLWRIFVLGTLRLCCNWDFDRLHEIANHHDTVRQMLGHGFRDFEYQYSIQTLKDNISLFTPEILDEINQVIIKAGHDAIGKKKDEKLAGRCDSYVLETHVHYPTDLNLLWDATRKVIQLTTKASRKASLEGWRQDKYLIKKAKKLFNITRKIFSSKPKTEKNKLIKEKQLKAAIKANIDHACLVIDKSKDTINAIKKRITYDTDKIKVIETFIKHAKRQIDQIQRRHFHGESIPHSEKVFSIFQEHTEWISKGKAGVPQELGLRVCILEDQYRFVLHHKVMQKTTDEKVTVPMTRETKNRFPDLHACSYDKGFYSPDNKKNLEEILDFFILPKKGRLTPKEQAIETSEAFLSGRNQHSAVESAINALENHGLDRCPDHGLDGFERYVALGIVGRNLHRLGHILQKKDLEALQRFRKRA